MSFMVRRHSSNWPSSSFLLTVSATTSSMRFGVGFGRDFTVASMESASIMMPASLDFGRPLE
jgi:hypothetical protein